MTGSISLGGRPLQRLFGGSPDKGAPPTGILGSVLRLALNVFNDLEIGRPEIFDRALRSEAAKVQRERSPEEGVPMNDLLVHANMETMIGSPGSNDIRITISKKREIPGFGPPSRIHIGALALLAYATWISGGPRSGPCIATGC